MALHPVEKARLLEGNWKIKFEAGTIFDRSWFPVGDRPVEEGTAVRFWDLAATAKEVAKSTSFYTCGVKLLKVGDIYYVIDIIYAQKKPGDVEQLIRSVALQDGKKVRVRWELEGGSAGKLFADMLLQKLQGFNAKAIKPIGDKVTRSYNTATAATQGKIFIVRANWNDQFLNAVQCFDGSPQPLINDIVDAFNGAYHELSQDRKALYDKLYS
jgi:predicted phage terminase large subunit-like protein